MRKGIGVLLLVIGVLVIIGVATAATKADYWLLSPKDKFLRSWQDDVSLLRKSKTLPPGWDHIRTIEIKSDNSPASTWVDSLRQRIPTDANGTYKLDVMVIHWIEGNRYGAIVQYTLIDTKTGNTVWEISRTLHLGYLI